MSTPGFSERQQDSEYIHLQFQARQIIDTIHELGYNFFLCDEMGKLHFYKTNAELDLDIAARLHTDETPLRTLENIPGRGVNLGNGELSDSYGERAIISRIMGGYRGQLLEHIEDALEVVPDEGAIRAHLTL